MDSRERLADARLYLCTPLRADLGPFVSTVCEAGVDVVQLRDKNASAREILRASEIVRDAAHAHGALFVLNDRPDLALECGADGVHVGQDDATPELCRRILGGDILVGLSTHAEGELDAALGQPIDYVSVGPVEPTPTKPGRTGTGLGYVDYAARRCTVPFFITGGVSAETLPNIAASGGRRFVVVRALTEAEDPGNAARRLRDLVDGLP